MTRDDVWTYLQEAIPGMVRAQRVESKAPAVIVAEALNPLSTHRYDVIDLTIEIPVVRMPDKLSEDPRVTALRKQCEDRTWSHTYVLGVSENWGGASYTFTLSVTVEKDAQP